SPRKPADSAARQAGTGRTPAARQAKGRTRLPPDNAEPREAGAQGPLPIVSLSRIRPRAPSARRDASFTRPQTVPRESRMNRHPPPPLRRAPRGGALLAPAARPRREPKAAEARFASAEELLRLAGQEGLFCYDGPRLPKPCSGYFLT